MNGLTLPRVLTTVVLTLMAWAASAQFPNKPIRFIVPYDRGVLRNAVETLAGLGTGPDGMPSAEFGDYFKERCNA
jgi:hypothetical protein